MVQDGCCVACGYLLMEKLCSTCSLFVLRWGVNSGCESSLAWVALGSCQASERRLGIVPLFLRWTLSVGVSMDTPTEGVYLKVKTYFHITKNYLLSVTTRTLLNVELVSQFSIF
jgi:hypothetical protein